MGREGKGTLLQDKEGAIEQLTQDFIVALSSDSVRSLANVDMMTAYVRATSYVRSLSSSQLQSLSTVQCSPCGSLKRTES